MIKGTGGIFEVRLGDELIYSKKATGRFPTPGEVTAILKARPVKAG